MRVWIKPPLFLCAATFWIVLSFIWCPAGAFTRPVVSARVYAKLATETDSAAVWVFLHDKDPLGDKLSRVAPTTSWISARAVERHRVKGLPLVTEDDRPISKDAVGHLVGAGLRVRTVSRWFTAVSGWVNHGSLKRIAEISWVDSVRVVQTYRRPLAPVIPKEESLPREMIPRDDEIDYGPSQTQLAQIGIIDAHRAGYDGSGVLIGFLDTGYNLDHEAFASTQVIDTWDFINGDEDVSDDDNSQMHHGTMTWSACGAFVPGKLIGAAYGADFMLAKTEIASDEIEIEEDFYVLGLEWFDSLGVDIVSSSLGYPDWYEYGDLNGRTAITTKAVNHAASRGILVVTAAGNEGNNKSRPWIIPPADSDSAIAVGAVLASGARWSSSSVGPTADGRIKPDVMAMGSQVWAAHEIDGQYLQVSGTSLATPLVAGACALILQQSPRLKPMELISRLHETSSEADSPDNEMGYGIVNLRQAMNLDSAVGDDFRVGPNPFTESIQFEFPSDTPVGEIKMRVFSTAGKMVFSHEIDGLNYTWDGRNNSGKRLAGGVYLCWFDTPSAEYTVKVAFMRQD